jgi:hypothetical protein
LKPGKVLWHIITSLRPEHLVVHLDAEALLAKVAGLPLPLEPEPFEGVRVTDTFRWSGVKH